ncbi:MAG: hypothetical protein OXJ52_09355 [Oligoflexia bacterium]|nr:hypothetical protein [Oligoflexia bacterium]
MFVVIEEHTEKKKKENKMAEFIPPRWDKQPKADPTMGLTAKNAVFHPTAVG